MALWGLIVKWEFLVFLLETNKSLGWHASSLNHISWYTYMNRKRNDHNNNNNSNNNNNHMVGNLDITVLCHALYSRMFTHFICLFCLICDMFQQIWFGRRNAFVWSIKCVSRKSSVNYMQISLPTPWTVVSDQWRCWHNGTISNCLFSKSIEINSSTEAATF